MNVEKKKEAKILTEKEKEMKFLRWVPRECDIILGMEDRDKVPEGYEVETDMFGFPYLRPKSTDHAPGWVKLVLGVLMLVTCIKYTIPVLDFIGRVAFGIKQTY